MSPRGPHPATFDEQRLRKECQVTRQRRSGPGGQHRNKVETAIRLTHRPTQITAEASERRSQAANLSAALRRLRMTLAIEIRQPVGDEPSDLWRSRCRNGTLQINPEHVDLPALLAEALDELAAAGWDLSAAAVKLSCSGTQLVKLLRREHRALALLNEHRQAASLPPLQ